MRRATLLAATTGARIEPVSAYEPVPETPPQRWSVSPRADVEDALREAAEEIEAAGVDVTTYARQGRSAGRPA